jgi:hypothetical protein
MNAKFLLRVLIKGVSIFLILNFLVIFLPDGIGRLSLYNYVFEGRQRLPFGEDSKHSYNLSLYDLDAMFASHQIAATSKNDDEFRVLIIGDSSVWGTLLTPEETLAGLLNRSDFLLCKNRNLEFYNLGYPTISLTKDLLVMDYALSYKPDLIIWLVTLDAFPVEKQLTSPIVNNNSVLVKKLIEKYNLHLITSASKLNEQSLWDKTLLGRRRSLADLIRLQIFGILWSATGIDQTYSEDYTRAQTDLNADIQYQGSAGPDLDEQQLSFDVLDAGMELAGDIPVLLVNEPILISNGENSHLRYNFLYPIWAYDSWRQLMLEKSKEKQWNYLDLWNLVPVDEFTNSAIHLMPEGEELLANRIRQTVIDSYCDR